MYEIIKSILVALVLLAIFIVPSFLFYGLPKIQYARADAAGKCQIDAKTRSEREQDWGNYYCDENNRLQSKRALAEKARDDFEKTATPKEKCEKRLSDDFVHGGIDIANDYICDKNGNTIAIEEFAPADAE